jgi:copper chaperone CopZ
VRVIPGVKKVEFDFNVMIVDYDEEIVSVEKIVEAAGKNSSRPPEVL